MVIGNDTRYSNPIAPSIGHGQNNGNVGSSVCIGNRQFVAQAAGQENAIIGHDIIINEGNFDRSAVVGHNTTVSGAAGKGILVGLGNDHTLNGEFDILIGYGLTSSGFTREIMIGNNGSATQTAQGRLYFVNVESVGSSGTIGGTTPDAYIPIVWNGGGPVYLPGYITKPA